MPIYQYRHPEHPIVIDIYQTMKELHVYVDDEGTEWKRVWSVPNAAVDTQVDPFSSSDFKKATKEKNCTMGELWDHSKELSEKRKHKLGTKTDPVREKYEREYAKKRLGRKHPENN